MIEKPKAQNVDLPEDQEFEIENVEDMFN